MKKIIFSFVVLLMFGARLSAQSSQAVYVELGGPGLASFNFDTRFSGKSDGFGGRIGFGGFSIDGDGAIFIPAGVNYLLGKDQKNYFELGVGVTPVFITSSSSGGDFSSTFGHLIFGYRMQPQSGGFTFRAFISPVFGEFGFLPYYGGVSFGYSFGKSKK